MTATIAKIKDGAATDEILPLIVRKTNSSIVVHNDDAFFLLVGDTGTGKSMLSLHMYEYAVNNPSIEQVAFDQPTMARALMNILELPRGERVLAYDEAYVSSRNSLSKYNKDLLELYSKIRGENVLHLWNTPSAQQIDKAMLFERIKAVLFVFTKTVHAPRMYAFFNRSAIKRIYDKEGNVEHDTLKKHMMKEADYIGCFRDYKGVLRGAYDDKKTDRGSVAVKEFGAKYLGQEGKHTAEIARLLNVDDHIMREYVRKASKAGEIVEGRDFVVKGTRILFLDNGVKYFTDKIRGKAFNVLGGVEKSAT